MFVLIDSILFWEGMLKDAGEREELHFKQQNSNKANVVWFGVGETFQELWRFNIQPLQVPFDTSSLEQPGKLPG